MIWGGAEAVMLALVSGCKYRLSLAERFDWHRDHNKSIACRLISEPYQWVASENKLRAPTDSALWWVVELFNYALQCNNNRNKVHNKRNALESSRNHPPTPSPWKNCLPQNRSLVPKRLGTTALTPASSGLLWHDRPGSPPVTSRHLWPCPNRKAGWTKEKKVGLP